MVEFLGLPVNASAHGHEIDNMIGLVHWLMLILFVIWTPFFIYVLYRFRQSKNPKANYHGAQGKLSTYQEVGVVVAELVLLFAFAIPAWSAFKNDFPATADASVVHVVGEQFAWNFHYPGPDGKFGARSIDRIDATDNPLGVDWSDPNSTDDITTINELHLPVDKPVIIHITSKDVIHSFGLNAMRVKQDAIPGLDIPVHFTPIKTGKYDISCAQLCGLGHYRMKGRMTIHTREGYADWVKQSMEEIEEYGR